MKTILCLMFFSLCPLPALADLTQAQNLMQAGRFEETMEELLPAARSGNAEAAQMIGVLYDLGLGVDQDYARAFDWYLRAAMQGHPSAAAAVAYYFETGRGLPAPDPMRAYVWYTLAAIGGDADAALSQGELLDKLSDVETSQADILIGDYKTWLFPFE